MLSFLGKRQRKQSTAARDRDRLSPPASPASFYSPGANITSIPEAPPPVPPLPPHNTHSLPPTSPATAFPHATRFPWSPGRDGAPPTISQMPPMKASASTPAVPTTSTVPASALSSNGSPEIQIDLGFTSESLFDGFPSGLFDRRRSAATLISHRAQPSNASQVLPKRTDASLGLSPIKIPVPPVKSLPLLSGVAPPHDSAPTQSQIPRDKPSPLHAPGPASPHAPSPISSSSSHTGSSYSSGSCTSDGFSYDSAPDLDWGISPGVSYAPNAASHFSPSGSGRRRSSTGSDGDVLGRHSHRLTRQDSATLPWDPDREAALAALGTPDGMRRRNSERSRHRRDSEAKRDGTANSERRHSRRNSEHRHSRHGHTRNSSRHSKRRTLSRTGSGSNVSAGGCGMLTPVEPMPEGAAQMAMEGARASAGSGSGSGSVGLRGSGSACADAVGRDDVNGRERSGSGSIPRRMKRRSTAPPDVLLPDVPLHPYPHRPSPSPSYTHPQHPHPHPHRVSRISEVSTTESPSGSAGGSIKNNTSLRVVKAGDGQDGEWGEEEIKLEDVLDESGGYGGGDMSAGVDAAFKDAQRDTAPAPAPAPAPTPKQKDAIGISNVPTSPSTLRIPPPRGVSMARSQSAQASVGVREPGLHAGVTGLGRNASASAVEGNTSASASSASSLRNGLGGAPVRLLPPSPGSPDEHGEGAKGLKKSPLVNGVALPLVNGVVLQVNGQTQQAQVNGQTQQVQANGQTQQVQTNGQTQQVQTNGQTQQAQANGQTQQVQTNGQTQQAQANGQTQTQQSPARNASVQSSEAAALTPPQRPQGHKRKLSDVRPLPPSPPVHSSPIPAPAPAPAQSPPPAPLPAPALAQSPPPAPLPTPALAQSPPPAQSPPVYVQSPEDQSPPAEQPAIAQRRSFSAPNMVPPAEQSPPNGKQFSAGARGAQFSPDARSGTSTQFSPDSRIQFSPESRIQFSPESRIQFSPESRIQLSPESRIQFSPDASSLSLSASGGTSYGSGSGSALWERDPDSATSVPTSQGSGPFQGSLGVRSASPAGSIGSNGTGKFVHPPRPTHSPFTPESARNAAAGKSTGGSAGGSGAKWEERKNKSAGDVTQPPATPASSNSTSASAYSSNTSSNYSSTSTATPATHGPAVRRVSTAQLTPDSRGTSPAPSNRYSITPGRPPGSPSIGRIGTLPIGSRPAAPTIERLQQRQRSGSEPGLTSPLARDSPHAAFDRSGPSAVHHRKAVTESLVFPETPRDFSPLLTPASPKAPIPALSTLPVPAPASIASTISVPSRQMMPKPPMIDPAPPPKRRDRPPLPIGPRKPSVRTTPVQSSTLSVSMTAASPPHVPMLPVSATSSHAPTSGSGSRSGFAPSSPKFQTRPVRWRGLTMDAAKWTFTSGQLQDIVGRAIRQSAEASSIRLLTLDVLDRELPEEIRRLEATREEIKSKYRASVRRRRVLFRSMSLYADGNDTQTRARLSQELVDVSLTCDQLSEDLFRIMDEMQQINKLRDVHSASALAMALRKLNSSFVKQSSNMVDLTKHMTQLEAERDEAWATAERVEQDLVELQAKMDVMGGASTPSSSAITSNRSSRVSAARKTSMRASKASLRFSRGARSSHSSTSSSRLSSLAPPVPPVPRLSYSQKLSLNTDLPSASVGSPYSMGMSSALANSPTAESRALAEAQNELYDMLGITRADLRRNRSGRYRPASEVVSPTSLPASPFPPSSGFMTRPASEAASPAGASRRRNASFSAHPRPADSMHHDVLQEA